ncbi:MAG: YbhN family protein, partial [Salinigranum sp.]
GFASLAVERVFDLLTITALAGSVLLGLAATGATDDLVGAVAGAGGAGRTAVFVAATVGLAAIVVTAVIVLSARTDRNVVRAVVSRAGSDSSAAFVADVVERFVADIQRGAGSPSAFGRVGASSVAIWTLDVATAVLVMSAFGVGLGPAALVSVAFFAVSVGNLAKVLPLSPGGIGLYEAAFTALVVGLTPVGAPTAFGAAILDHAVKNAVTVVGGAASMLVLNVSLTTAVDRSSGARDLAESAQD